MTTFKKIAFYDPDTEEYYSGESYDTPQFNKNISKAKLYSEKTSGMPGYFSYVKSTSRRNLISIDVEITYNISKTDNNLPMLIIQNQIATLEERLLPLSKSAEVDVDLLSEKDYQLWKKLNRMLKELNEMIDTMS